MALDDIWTVTRPGQVGATGDIDALHLEEFSGMVEGTIARKSKLEGFIKRRSVRGTSVFSNNGVGKTTLQKVTPGVTPDGIPSKAGKKSLQVDTLVLAREAFPLLETWQLHFDRRSETAKEHGKLIAKFTDQSFFIQALKAAKLTDTAYSGLSGAGHFGGSQQVLAAAGDALDPALLYQAISDLFVKMENKDVDPATDDIVIAMRPEQFHALGQNELLINRQYVTSDGVSIEAAVLKAYGCPVISSINFPGSESISGHLLSNADNGNAYDGDFTKDVVVAFSPRALMAGETIPLTTNVHWDPISLVWLVDAYLSYAVGPDRAEFAGVISKP